MHISTISALGRSIRVGTNDLSQPRRPLLLFNGIGASIELVAPFTEAMQRAGIPSVVFDIPGGPAGTYAGQCHGVEVHGCTPLASRDVVEIGSTQAGRFEAVIGSAG
jgi:hypothetical protein